MGMTNSIINSRIQITKLAAAQRQLRAAIRMFFSGFDELAVHTVASASYSLISDLKKKLGRDEASDYYLTSIFYVVREYRRGTLPKQFTNDPETVKWIKNMAEQLPITESTSYGDVKASISSEAASTWWSKRNRAANFLKHADRDAHEHILLDEIDNLFLLMLAVSSLNDLINNDIDEEGLILWVYYNVFTGTTELLPDRYQEIGRRLEELRTGDRLSFCSALLTNLQKYDAPPTLQSGDLAFGC